MGKLVSFILACLLCVGLVSSAAHAENLIGLKVCSEVPAFQERMNDRLSALEAKVAAAKPGTTQFAIAEKQLADTSRRFEAYSKLLCGEEGLPHLITDGRLNHAGEFLIPGLAFLYLAGWLGWAGRSYLIAVRKDDNPELKESTIDVPLALQCFVAALAWPLVAFKEISSGEIAVPDKAVPISPR
ncbi:MAG: Photosystem I reaction center subunit III [Thermostichales cyanobacterium BF4_bins_65]